jgi:hypothetical protein
VAPILFYIVAAPSAHDWRVYGDADDAADHDFGQRPVHGGGYPAGGGGSGPHGGQAAGGEPAQLRVPLRRPPPRPRRRPRRGGALRAGATFLGCTTAGEITERGLTHGGVAALVVSSPDTAFELRTQTGVKADPALAARHLCEGFAATAKAAAGAASAPPPRSCWRMASTARARSSSTRSWARPARSSRCGRSGGDDGAFQATTVEAAPRPTRTGPPCCTRSRARPGEWASTTASRPPRGRCASPAPPATWCTSWTGARPSTCTASTHRRRACTSSRERGTFLIGNELGILVFDEIKRARAPLSVVPTARSPARRTSGGRARRHPGRRAGQHGLGGEAGGGRGPEDSRGLAPPPCSSSTACAGG